MPTSESEGESREHTKQHARLHAMHGCRQAAGSWWRAAHVGSKVQEGEGATWPEDERSTGARGGDAGHDGPDLHIRERAAARSQWRLRSLRSASQRPRFKQRTAPRRCHTSRRTALEPTLQPPTDWVTARAQFVDGLAGSSGGVVAITVFYPLNKIRENAPAADASRGLAIQLTSVSRCLQAWTCRCKTQVGRRKVSCS